MRKLSLLLPAVLLITCLSCTRVRVDVPEGFARQRTWGEYHAISPEGLRFSVRTVKNYPRKELAFWKDVLKAHLEEEGYTPLGEGEPFRAGDVDGTVYEWAVPLGQDDYVYLVAVMPAGRRIIIAEAAGEHTLFARYRQALYECLQTVSLRF
jgi:hypothetical protein